MYIINHQHIKSFPKFIIITIIFLLCGCGSVKYIYLPSETKIEYRDSTVYKDSIVYRPVEVIKEVSPVYDTLRLETSLAKASAYVDTVFNVIKGEIKNKSGVKERVVYKEKTVYRDSVKVVEVPVEVEKQVIEYKHFWYEKILVLFALIGVISIAKILIRLYAVKK